jgi:hypothetical protein
MPATPQLTIPDRELDAFKSLASTEIALLESLAGELTKHRPVLDIELLTKEIAQAADLSLDAIAPVTRLLWQLALVQRHFGLGTKEFLEALTASLAAKPSDKWSEEDRLRWAERSQVLIHLLSPSNSAVLSAKASDLLFEQQLAFCTSRVITDIRPVLDDQAESFQGLLPFHSLVIEYYENRETKEVHIAMDLNDLKQLRSQLDRAEKKELLIRETFPKFGFEVIKTWLSSDEGPRGVC